jgi:hypothetical protein
MWIYGILMLCLQLTTNVEYQVADLIFDQLDNPYIRARYPDRLDKALRLVPVITQNSEDPLLMAQIIFWESRWDPKAKGKARSEVGLMQLHGRAWGPRGQYDKANPRDQVLAGIQWYSQALQRCNGSTLQAINCYGTGYCRPVREFAKRRYRTYRRLRWKYERRTLSEDRRRYYERLKND